MTISRDVVYSLEHAGELRINILRRIKGKRAPKSYRNKQENVTTLVNYYKKKKQA